MPQLAQYRITGRGAREISASIERELREGRLRPGDALPTVRGLAARLRVSPATVAAAYRQARERGILAGAGRAGTRVRDAPPISVQPPTAAPAGMGDLRSGGPDPALLPALPGVAGTKRLYGDPPMSPRLATVAAERLAADGLDVSSLAVVGGALDGVERVLGAWLRPGDPVAVEDPGYAATLDLLAALRLDVLPVGLDERGARPEHLRAALERGARAVVLTPRAQNPTGCAWDAQRARKLRSVLRAYPEVLVVEDDHAGPAAGTPPFTVCRGRACWATVRSVSKWLGPDLRLAVLAGDAITVSRVEGRQALGTGWVSYLLQDTVAQLWSKAATARLLDRAAATYTRRRRALTESLAAHGFTVTGSSGLTVWLPIRDEHAVVAALGQDSWAVTPGERFRIASGPGIRIAFATLDGPEAREFAASLARAVRRRRIRAG